MSPDPTTTAARCSVCGCSRCYLDGECVCPDCPKIDRPTTIAVMKVWRWWVRAWTDVVRGIPDGLDLLVGSVGFLIRAVIVTALLLSIPAFAAAAVIAALR